MTVEGANNGVLNFFPQISKRVYRDDAWEYTHMHLGREIFLKKEKKQ